MEDHKCPLCGGELECLGGASAHYSNWYCKDTKKCGWQAWEAQIKGLETNVQCSSPKCNGTGG